MDKLEAIESLQASLKRVVQVKEWCGMCKLHNVAADMRQAQNEIERVIYFIQAKDSK